MTNSESMNIHYAIENRNNTSMRQAKAELALTLDSETVDEVECLVEENVIPT